MGWISKLMQTEHLPALVQLRLQLGLGLPSLLCFVVRRGNCHRAREGKSPPRLEAGTVPGCVWPGIGQVQREFVHRQAVRRSLWPCRSPGGARIHHTLSAFLCAR